MKIAPVFALLALAACAALSSPSVADEKHKDGQCPPPKAPADLKWDNLLSGKLEEKWTGMSMAIDSPLIKATDAGNGNLVLHIDRGPTGLIRSMKSYENFILEYEFRHLTEAPSAGGGKGTSGNSGLLICHGPFPKAGGPYPGEGHEIQVCNLGNGTWYTSHGDTFTLPGTISQAIPDPRFAVSHACGHRSMPLAFNGSKTGEWNKIRVTCVDGVIQHEVNGTLATSLYRATPRTGYISFESEGAPVEFRNMRIHELAADPDLLPKHRSPVLPEEMTCNYVTDKSKAVTLPSGSFIAMVDVNGKVALDELVDGLALGDAQVSGRLLVTAKDGKTVVTADGKEVASVPWPKALPAIPRTLRLEAAKTGHVLVFKPVKM